MTGEYASFYENEDWSQVGKSGNKMNKTNELKMHGRKGTLHCSLHGIVTSEIDESEVPACCEAHKNAGCPLALTWKHAFSGGYRG